MKLVQRIIVGSLHRITHHSHIVVIQRHIREAHRSPTDLEHNIIPAWVRGPINMAEKVDPTAPLVALFLLHLIGASRKSHLVSSKQELALALPLANLCLLEIIMTLQVTLLWPPTISRGNNSSKSIALTIRQSKRTLGSKRRTRPRTMILEVHHPTRRR